MTKFQANVRFIPAHFNRIAFCNIPARWTAEVHDGLPQGVFVYSDGCQSRQEAINDLIASLKSRGYHGSLKIINY